jgi:hypothetical protein
MEQLDYTNYLTSKKLSDLGVHDDSKTLWVSSEKMGTKLFRKYSDYRYRCIDDYNTFIESCLLENDKYCIFETYRSYNLQQIIDAFPSSMMIKITRGINCSDQIEIFGDVYENKIIKERRIGISTVSSDKNHSSLVKTLASLLIELLECRKFKLDKELKNK